MQPGVSVNGPTVRMRLRCCQPEVDLRAMPIGPLMQEHRLIERMIALMGRESFRLKCEKQMDRVSLKVAVHFIRTYGDRCPRGREDILFRQLAKKRVSDEAAASMAEFVEEHAYRRRTMGELVRAKERYVDGDMQAPTDAGATLEDLRVLIPERYATMAESYQ